MKLEHYTLVRSPQPGVHVRNVFGFAATNKMIRHASEVLTPHLLAQWEAAAAPGASPPCTVEPPSPPPPPLSSPLCTNVGSDCSS